MARIKEEAENAKIAEINAKVIAEAENAKIADNVVSATQVEGAAENIAASLAKEEKAKVAKKKQPEEQEIPDDVKRILELYPKEEKLYVNKHGGVYTSDSKPKMTGNAILYKNPFYNNK